MKEKMVKLVIEIPEKLNNKSFAYLTEEEKQTILNAVDSGVLLPKGHGRLIDMDMLDNVCVWYHTDDDGSWCYKWADIHKVPTIIEADKEEED